MFLALLLAAAPQSTPTVADVQARIARTSFVVVVQLSEWKEDPAMKKALGEKALLAGGIAPEGSLLTVLVEPNDPPLAPQTWRERLAPPGEHFAVGITPCVEASSELEPGLFRSDLHGYFATRTHVLDIHVSRTGSPDERFPRAEFERIVRSVTVQLLRRGWAEDYPGEIGSPMTVGAILGEKGWRADYAPKHADEWPVAFVHAELLREWKAPFDEQVAAYDRALELLGRAARTDAPMRFATAILHDGKSLALYDAKRHADSIAPLEAGFAILDDLRRKERASLSYNLACVHALLEHREPAIAALKRAIEVDPRFRAYARKDADFRRLAADSEFERLVAEPVKK